MLLPAECFPEPSNVTCPRPAWVYQDGSYMFPGCWNDDCGTQFGALLDGNSSTRGMTGADNLPHIMFDLGFERTDVQSVDLTLHEVDSNEQRDVVSVYLSTVKPFDASGSVRCRANVLFPTLIQPAYYYPDTNVYAANAVKLAVLCPPGVPARYVTVSRMSNNTNMVSPV